MAQLLFVFQLFQHRAVRIQADGDLLADLVFRPVAGDDPPRLSSG